MRISLALLVATVLACAACSGALVPSTAALGEEEQCRRDGGMWRVGWCEPCGGGM